MKTVTRRLERPLDLVAFAGDEGHLFVRDGVGLAGRGEAARLPRADAQELLADVAVDDDVRRPGTGVVAFGSLPFAPGAGGELVVPAVTVGRDADGTAWVTFVDGADDDLAPTPPPRARGAASRSAPAGTRTRSRTPSALVGTPCGPGVSRRWCWRATSPSRPSTRSIATPS